MVVRGGGGGVMSPHNTFLFSHRKLRDMSVSLSAALPRGRRERRLQDDPFGCFNKVKKEDHALVLQTTKEQPNGKLYYLLTTAKKKKSKAKEEEILQSKPPQQQQQEGAAESEQCFEGEEDDPLVWRIS